MLTPILIFLLQILYVPIMTLRITFVVKGKRMQASFVSLLEALIYIIGLGIVFSDLSNLPNIISYVLGYSVGIYLGCILEEKLAIGFRSVHVSIKNDNPEMIQLIRSQNYGVTGFHGKGMNDENRYRYDIITPRNREKELMELVIRFEPNAFIVSYEPTQFKGGYIGKQLRGLISPLGRKTL